MPERLRIGPYTWQVFCDKKSWKKLAKEDPQYDQAADGVTFGSKQEIYVRPGIKTLDYERIVVLHEIMHAARDSSHLDKLDLNDAEESFIRYTTPVLYGVLRDNPDLIDYLGLT